MHDRNLIYAIGVCKELIERSRINGYGGTSAPGEEAMKICPEVLRLLSADVRSVMVCGTNGKTTVCRMLSNIFQSRGIECVSNRAGANKIPGIVTAFCENADEEGRLSRKTAVIECDEMYSDEVSGILHPQCIVFTNLSWDQPYRMTLEEVKKRLLKAVEASPEAVVCINRDDEALMSLLGGIPNAKLYYGISGNAVCLGERTLPITENTLRPTYLYDAAAACCAAGFFGIPEAEALTTALETKFPFARMESFSLGNSRVTMELLKNPASFRGVLRDMCSCPPYSVLIIASDDARELSWMEGEDFAALRQYFRSVYVWGTDADAAFLRTQLSAEEIDTDGIIRFCTERSENVFLLVEYYAMLKIRKRIAADGYLPPFWEV